MKKENIFAKYAPPANIQIVQVQLNVNIAQLEVGVQAEKQHAYRAPKDIIAPETDQEELAVKVNIVEKVLQTMLFAGQGLIQA